MQRSILQVITSVSSNLKSPEIKAAPSPQSPCSPSPSIYSLDEFAEPNQTIIFLDWDDTLFPTSQLLDAWHLPSRAEQWAEGLALTKAQEAALEDWQDALYKYLVQASLTSDAVVILTNADRPWVDRCLDQFASNVCSAIRNLPGVKVVYAKEFLTREHLDRGCPVRTSCFDAEEKDELYREMLKLAKLRAMQHEVKTFYSRYHKQTWKNVISIGDSQYEHDAAQDLALLRRTPRREHLRLKTIMTPANPSITSLCSRLRLGSSSGLARLVQLDDDLDIDMNSQEGMQTFAAKFGLNPINP